MNTETMIKVMQDPMGAPFYPIVFQILMVLTFSLHIIFVNLTIGTSAIAVYSHIKKGGYWPRLSTAMAKATPVNVSMAILLGVAPLLFVQVIYDPFWYASNTLSASWAMLFVIFMMTGYGLAYVFYLKRQKTKSSGIVMAGVVSLALFVLSGIIMHSLGYQLLQPEKWLDWYVNGGRVDTSGSSLHSFHVSRFLHFMAPSFAITGVFMMLYAWYFKDRADMDKEYLGWVGKIGAKTAFIFTVIQAIIGFWWLLSLPGGFNFITNPFFLIALVLGIGLLLFLYTAKGDPNKYALPVAAIAFVTIFGMSYAREALRTLYLGRFGYSIFEYKVNLNIGSTILFLCTFAMGLVIISYFLTVVFKSGRMAGQYDASPSMHQWGKINITLLLIWIAIVAGLGIVITARNFF